MLHQIKTRSAWKVYRINNKEKLYTEVKRTVGFINIAPRELFINPEYIPDIPDRAARYLHAIKRLSVHHSSFDSLADLTNGSI